MSIEWIILIMASVPVCVAFMDVWDDSDQEEGRSVQRPPAYGQSVTVNARAAALKTMREAKPDLSTAIRSLRSVSVADDGINRNVARPVEWSFSGFFERSIVLAGGRGAVYESDYGITVILGSIATKLVSTPPANVPVTFEFAHVQASCVTQTPATINEIPAARVKEIGEI